MPNEQEEFLKEFEPKSEDTVLDAPIIPETTPEVAEEDTEEQKGNRRERRLEAKLQQERESSIALAARLDALTEAQKLSRDTEPEEYLKAVEQIYGNDSPEKIAATELLKTALKGVESRATQNALSQFREEQRQAEEAVQSETRSLDSMVDDIEDTYGTELDPQTRKTFFNRLEKLSPKDSDGNVIAYADHHAVWEDLQSRKQPQNTRAKDLASRSMVKTGATAATGVEVTANERWLRENGLI